MITILAFGALPRACSRPRTVSGSAATWRSGDRGFPRSRRG